MYVAELYFACKQGVCYIVSNVAFSSLSNRFFSFMFMSKICHLCLRCLRCMCKETFVRRNDYIIYSASFALYNVFFIFFQFNLVNCILIETRMKLVVELSFTK